MALPCFSDMIPKTPLTLIKGKQMAISHDNHSRTAKACLPVQAIMKNLMGLEIR
jgi:hypothetical protein